MDPERTRQLREVGRTTIRWLPLCALTAWGVVGVGQFVTGGGMEHIGQDKKDRYTPKTQEYKHFDRMQRQGRELMIGGLVRTAQGSAGALVGLALWAAVPPVRRPEDNKVVSVIITL